MDSFDLLRIKYSEVMKGKCNTHSDLTLKCIEYNDKMASAYLKVLDTQTYESCSTSGAAKINSLLKKVAFISSVIMQPDSQMYRNDKIINKIINILKKLLTVYNDSTTPMGNWWYWEIGIPLSLNNIFILLYEYIDRSTIEEYTKAQVHFHDRITMTGANRVWEAVIFAMRGILTKDSNLITYALKSISDVTRIVNNGDGFYRDGSFIQHNNIPYNCGYGRSLIQELAPVIYVFNETDYKIDHIDIVYKWIQDSYLPFMYNGRCMDMVRGREISRYYEQSDFAFKKMLSAMLILSKLNRGQYLKPILKHLITDDFFDGITVFASEIAESIIKNKNITEKEVVPYFKAFNSMDRVVKHTKDYCIGISMHSERTAAFESINSENENAFHTSDGMMYVYKKNEPESDFFWQTIDLYRLPGTTVIKDSKAKPNINAKGDFTGGCGIGEYGVCSMKLISDENSLKANKSWFFFENEIVCLGSGISCTDDINVETIIENRLVTDNSRFVLRGIEDGEGYLAKGAYLNGSHDIGYYFPEEQKVNIVRQVREGNWHNMSTKTDGKSYQGMYLTMWIDHGKTPQNDSYEYIIIPKCNESEIKEYSKNNKVEIIENSTAVQCVKKNGVTGAVFLKDRTHSVEGISCDKRCVLITKYSGEILEISGADITQKSDKICIELDYSAKTVTHSNDNIKILQLDPYISFEVNTENSEGNDWAVEFSGVKKI